MLELPWFLASDSITKAYYEYDDVFGTHHKEEIKNMNSGTIVLDANVPHKDLRVVCNYKVRGDKGVYEIEGVSSSTLNVPLIHAPIGMIARPLGDTKAKVELTWSVPYPDDEDLMPTDFFVIQRSLTGKEEDFHTIAQEFYSKTTKKTTYTFIDSTWEHETTIVVGVLTNQVNTSGRCIYVTSLSIKVLDEAASYKFNVHKL